MALSAPHHSKSNQYIERHNKTFQEALTSFCNARQDNWDECLTPYEFEYNISESVNQSLGETLFFLNVPSLAVEGFTQNLQNRILEARDHICKAQETG